MQPHPCEIALQVGPHACCRSISALLTVEDNFFGDHSCRVFLFLAGNQHQGQQTHNECEFHR